jgi:excinuclease UvrABC nuclease subunit
MRIKRLSSEAFTLFVTPASHYGEIPCYLSCMWRLSCNPGVYLFTDLRGPLYIGRTNNLRRRYEEHLRRPENDILDALLRNPSGQLRFVWFEIEDGKEREQLEKHLIQLLKPPSNKILYGVKTNK